MYKVLQKNIHWCWRYFSGRTKFSDILSIWASKNNTECCEISASCVLPCITINVSWDNIGLIDNIWVALVFELPNLNKVPGDTGKPEIGKKSWKSHRISFCKSATFINPGNKSHLWRRSRPKPIYPQTHWSI